MSTIAERTRREREAQGLLEHVDDDGVLDRVAELLAVRLDHGDADADREGGGRASP